MRSLVLPATTSAAADVITAASRKAWASPRSTARSASALWAASPPLRSSTFDRFSPTDSGVISKLVILPSLQVRDPRRAGGHDLVKSTLTMADPAGLAAEVLQNLRQRLDPGLRKHARHLTLDACRIGEGAKQIEDRARAELDAGRADVLHRGVMRRGEHEAQPGLAQCSSEIRSGARSIFTPSAISTSAAPDFEDRARLPCLATLSPAPAATKAAQVEML